MFNNLKVLLQKLFCANNEWYEDDIYSETSYDPSEKSFDPGDCSDEEEDLDPDNWEEETESSCQY